MERLDARKIKFKQVGLLGKLCLLTDKRVDSATIPAEFKVYEVSHADGDINDPCSIERQVARNFYGTIISKSEVDLCFGLAIEAYRTLSSDCHDLTILNCSCSLAEYAKYKRPTLFYTGKRCRANRTYKVSCDLATFDVVVSVRTTKGHSMKMEVYRLEQASCSAMSHAYDSFKEVQNLMYGVFRTRKAMDYFVEGLEY